MTAQGASGYAAPWCRWRRGSSGLLLIAPHGGRRPSEPWNGARDPKVNDLNTADLAFALASRLEAALIVNRSLDRNILDLNRISQVVRHAPWFIALIEDLVSDILDRHARAEVLFVHGWNVVQPRCDIGIGGSFADEEDLRGQDGALTAGAAYVTTRLAAFRRCCEAAGVRVTYGERYPASHPNNLVQLFRRDAGSAPRAGARLAAWAMEGRVHGVQLELGVPLRWPGAMRERFLAATTRAFASSDSGAEEAPRRRATAPTPSGAEAPAALEFYDPGCGVGFSSSIGRARGQSLVTARLLVLAGRQRAALFVGENPQPREFNRDGPYFEHDDAGLRLRFEGHLLELEDAREYVRLEDAFAASTLLPFQVDLSFRASRGSHGRVVGSIRSAERCWRIDCHGFARSTALERPFELEDAYTNLSASFGGGLALRARSAGPRSVLRLRSQGEETLALSALEVDLEPDRLTPRRFYMTFGEQETVSAEPLSRLAIVRPLARGGQARTTIGAARFRSRADGRGFGFYEYSIPIARAVAADLQT